MTAKAKKEKRVRLVSPKGKAIVGTWETLRATAFTHDFIVNSHGALVPNYAGESEVHWESQDWMPDDTATGARKELCVVDEEGTVWPLSACKRVSVRRGAKAKLPPPCHRCGDDDCDGSENACPYGRT